jgi:hypothetical protein
MRIHLSSGTTLTNVEGKDVLFSVRSGDSYGLNETAAQMVRLALEVGVNDAATRLAGEYNAPAEQLRADLDELVGELAQLKLLDVSPRQGG